MIQTAEALTRFLRSKDTPVSEIVAVALSFLLRGLDVNLPNGHWFIFELVCDRLNDFNRFKHWKSTPEVWKLAATVWPQLTDTSRRNKLLRRVKIADVLALVLRSKDSVLLNEVYSTLELFQRSFDIEIDEFASVTLLRAYTDILEPEFDQVLLLKWTILIKQLYDISHMEIDYTPTRKAIDRFYKDCVPTIANKICCFDPDSQIFGTLTQLIEESAFTKTASASITTNVEGHLKSQSLSFSALEYIFGLLVQKFGTKEVNICEEVFLLAVKSQNYSNVTETLMGVLAGLKKPLSLPFLTRVYDETVASEKVNWTLMGHLIDLDVTLALDKVNQIVEKLNASSRADVVSISGKLLNAFAKSRELVGFFTNIWFNAIDSNMLWESPELIEGASEVIHELTTTQIIDILTTLSEKLSPRYPILLSLVKGLLNASQKIVDSVEPSFHRYLYTDAEYCSWELRYLLATLYKPQDIPKHNAPTNFDKFYLFYSFRVVEITGEDVISKKLKASLFTEIKKHPEDSLLATLLERWSVLINSFFTDDEIRTLVGLIIDSDKMPLIQRLLESSPEVFLEQSKIVSQVLDAICSELNEETISLLPLFPMECYSRSQRITLLDALAKHKFTENSTKAIRHLVSVPSFKALIETDFEVLVSILGVDDHLMPICQKIFRIVWTSHTRQLESQEFVKASFTKTIEKISKVPVSSEIPNTRIVQAGFIMMQVETKENASSAKKLRSTFFDFACKLAHSQLKSASPDTSSISWALSILRDCVTHDRSVRSDVKALVTKMGNRLGLESEEVTPELFSLLVITTDLDFISATHIILLYSIFYDKHKSTNLTDSLEDFFVRLYDSFEVYTKTIEYVIYSFDKDITENNVDIFVRLINAIIKSLHKNDSKLTEKVIFIVSLILSHFDVITAHSLEPLALFLGVIKSALNTKSWVFNQYSIEQIMTLITNVGKLLDTHNSELAETAYVLSTQVVAHVLLYHRYRLNSRHHLVIGTFVALMKPLCLKRVTPNSLENSINASSAYTRLLVNLCEPPNASKLVVNQLTTASSLIKKTMKPYLPVLLIDYITYSLRFNFSKTNNNELRSGIHSIFNVLSKDELESVNNLLDGPGKSFFKAVYNDYKEHGKWKDN